MGLSHHEQSLLARFLHPTQNAETPTATVRREGREAMTKPRTEVVVRWWDGYLESFGCSEARFGSDLLWMHLVNGQNRHVPLRGVRWFSLDPESHAPTPTGEKPCP